VDPLSAARWEPKRGAWFAGPLLANLALLLIAELLFLDTSYVSGFLLPAVGMALTAAAGADMLTKPLWRREGLQLVGAVAVATLIDVIVFSGVLMATLLVHGD
jgi:hypothetical protein